MEFRAYEIRHISRMGNATLQYVDVDGTCSVATISLILQSTSLSQGPGWWKLKLTVEQALMHRMVLYTILYNPAAHTRENFATIDCCVAGREHCDSYRSELGR
jgi:hypothetical protein